MKCVKVKNIGGHVCVGQGAVGGAGKCLIGQRVEVHVITYMGKDAFCVYVYVCEMAEAKKCGMMRVGVCQGARVYNNLYVCVVETIK